MNAELLSQWLVGLPSAARAKALVRVGFELTIYAREYGAASHETKDDSLGRKLIGINELQHKLLSQAGLYSDGEENKVYPANVFSQVLFQTAAQYGISTALVGAVGCAQSRVAE